MSRQDALIDAAALRLHAAGLSYNDAEAEAVAKHRLNEIATRIETGYYANLQYSAEDMADAQAKAFRAGVSSFHAVVDRMATRLMGWKLPADFNPDGGISFKPYHPQQTPDNPMWPTGTNLLTHEQAKAMFEYVMEGAQEPQALTRDRIREIFMAHGFTVKDGQADLKEYVYEAATALLAEAQWPQTITPAELAKRIERGEKWEVAQQPQAESLESLLSTAIGLLMGYEDRDGRDRKSVV